MCRSWLLALWLGVALLGMALVPGDAAAHLGSRLVSVEVTPAPLVSELAMQSLAWSAAPAADPVPWPLGAALVTLLALGARRPRPALVLALMLVLAVFAFESGVHSVHHLADRDGGQHCAVAAASQHVTGTEVDAVLTAATLPEGHLLAVSGATIERARFAGPDQGRAPPVVPA